MYITQKSAVQSYTREHHYITFVHFKQKWQLSGLEPCLKLIGFLCLARITKI